MTASLTHLRRWQRREPLGHRAMADLGDMGDIGDMADMTVRNARSSEPAPAVLCRGVSKRYGRRPALDGVSLQIRPGEVVGLLGTNGAGKSTLCRIIAGVQRPDRGQVRVLGADPRRPATRRHLGVAPQENALPPLLRVEEVLGFVAAHFADPLPSRDVLSSLDLTGLRHRPCGALSVGQQRRVSIALALLGRPNVLLVDEPTAGLDAATRHTVGTLIGGVARTGTAVLLTSHDMRDVTDWCDRAVVLHEGRTIAQDRVDALRAAWGSRSISVTTAAPPAVFDTLPAVTQWSADRVPGVPDGRYTLRTSDSDATVRALFERVGDASDVLVANPDLDESIAALIRAGGDAEPVHAEPVRDEPGRADGIGRP